MNVTAADSDQLYTCAGEEVPANTSAEVTSQDHEEGQEDVGGQHGAGSLEGAIHAAPFLPHR